MESVNKIEVIFSDREIHSDANITEDVESQNSAIKSDIGFNKTEFMELIRKHPEIYDKYHVDFKDKNLKLTAWSKIGSKFNMTSNEAEAKYNSVRSSYGRYLRKRSDTTESKRLYPDRKYPELQWLEPFIEHRVELNRKLTTTPCYIYEDATESRTMVEQRNYSAGLVLDRTKFENATTSGVPPKRPRYGLDGASNSSLRANFVASHSNTQEHCAFKASVDSTSTQKKSTLNYVSTDDGVKDSIVAALTKINSFLENHILKDDAKDEVALFLNSISPSLRRLSSKDFGLAKLHICQYLFSLEHPNV